MEPVENAFYTFDEMRARLNISERHLRKLVYRRDIPYYKVGHLLRFDGTEISRWLERNHHGVHA